MGLSFSIQMAAAYIVTTGVLECLRFQALGLRIHLAGEKYHLVNGQIKNPKVSHKNNSTRSTWIAIIRAGRIDLELPQTWKNLHI